MILGVDPGSRYTGYAALRRVGRRFSVEDSGVITLTREPVISARLGLLQRRLEQIVERINPDVAAVEDIFTAHNARSALKLGQARGVVLAVMARHELDVYAYPPATVKRAVAGHGRAAKEQIQQMVQVLLSLKKAPRPDEADAMAVAVCHGLCQRGASLGNTAGAART